MERERPAELPGGELPNAVYRSVAFAFAWMMLAAWIAFARERGLDFDLSVGLVLFVIAGALPWIIRTTASHHMPAKSIEVRPFLYSEVDTATGPLTGREVWFQIILVPASLALAATLIGLVYVFDH